MDFSVFQENLNQLESGLFNVAYTCHFYVVLKLLLHC